VKRRVQFPGATAYKDRHGKRRWRFRKGRFSTELGKEYGSDEFVERYEAAVQGHKTRGLIGADRTVSGSLSGLIASYYRSPAFLGLADSTKSTYRGIIEPLREKHGTKRVTHLERRHVIGLLAEKADTPNAANNLRKRLRQLLDHAVDLGWIRHNPAKTVRAYKVPAGGHHAWDEGEIAQFLPELPASMRSSSVGPIFGQTA